MANAELVTLPMELIITRFLQDSGIPTVADTASLDTSPQAGAPSASPIRTRQEIQAILWAEGVTFVPKRSLKILTLADVFNILHGLNVIYGSRLQTLAAVRVEELLKYVYLFEAMVDPFTSHTKRRRWRDHLIRDVGKDVCQYYDWENQLRGNRLTVAVGSMQMLGSFAGRNGQTDDAAWINSISRPLSANVVHGGYYKFRYGDTFRKKYHPGYENMRSTARKVQLVQYVEDSALKVLDHIQSRA